MKDLMDLVDADLKLMRHELECYRELRTDEDPPALRADATKKGLRYRQIRYKDEQGQPCYETTWLGGGEEAAVREIQANHFYNLAIKMLEKDIRAAEQFQKHYVPHDPASITRMLSMAYRPTDGGLWLPGQDPREEGRLRAAQQQREKEERAARQRERFGTAGYGVHGIRTVTGEMVRSKGEALIYSALHAADLPFVYEDTIWLRNATGARVAASSDFHIFPNREDDVVWEHAGMFGEPGYRRRFEEKIELYYDNGYTLGDRLIVTMDDKDGTLNCQSLQQIVEALKAR